MTDHSITRDPPPASFPSSVLQQQKQILSWPGKEMGCDVSDALKRGSAGRFREVQVQPSLRDLALQTLTAGWPGFH